LKVSGASGNTRQRQIMYLFLAKHTLVYTYPPMSA